MGGFSKRKPETQRRAPAPSPTGDFLTLEASAVFAYLSSSPEGLEAGEAARRLRLHGPNEIARPQPPQLRRLLFAQVSHTLALLLWAAAALALLAGLPPLAWAIVAIVLINAAFSFWQEYRASQLVRALHGRMPPGARVRRD